MAIALGSNLGDREAHLQYAATALAGSVRGLMISSFYETDPVGVEPQPRFVNAAAVGTTALSARDLLERVLAIEQTRGRTRPRPGAPRTLDLDVILYGGAVIEEPGLVVPHPRFRERLFVLEPLAEIAPDLIDPVTGVTVRGLLERARSG